MIYFDHAAAVPVLPEVKLSYGMLLDKYSGNIEAAHQQGHRLSRELEKLQNSLFEVFLPGRRCEQKACFFGSDATELINLLGLALADKNSTVWSSALEHAAMQSMLKRSFGSVCELTLDRCGNICDFPENGNEVKLVVMTHVQSEIGVMQDLPELIKKVRQAAPQALIAVDMVQSAMFYRYPDNAILPDMLLISGAKTGAGSGAALLAVGKSSLRLKTEFELLRKKEYLAGKPNLVQAAALVLAAQISDAEKIENIASIASINDFLRTQLSDMVLPNGKKCILTVPGEYAAKNILHFILPGYQAGVLVRMFSQENIMLSSGSACQAESDEPSRILQKLNYSKSDSYSGLRLSFSGSNTLHEAEEFLAKLKMILKNY